MTQVKNLDTIRTYALGFLNPDNKDLSTSAFIDNVLSCLEIKNAEKTREVARDNLSLLYGYHEKLVKDFNSGKKWCKQSSRWHFNQDLIKWCEKITREVGYSKDGLGYKIYKEGDPGINKACRFNLFVRIDNYRKINNILEDGYSKELVEEVRFWMLKDPEYMEYKANRDLVRVGRATRK